MNKLYIIIEPRYLKGLLVLLSIAIGNSAFAQGLTKNGKVTNTGSEYVNKNGAIGSPNGVDKNGKIVTAVSLPAVTTTAITSIRGTTATSGGNVISTGGLTIADRGVCWSTTPNPTTSHNTLSQGAGVLGSFTSNLTGLTQNTLYYARAYATNSLGTAYGDEINFVTTSIVIGENYQGGKVAWLDVNSDGLIIGGFVVSGEQGTRDRYNIGPVQTAANQSPGLGGYRDWILPNSDQLATICNNRGAIGGSFSNSVHYWSANPTHTIQVGVDTHYFGRSFFLGATASCSEAISSVSAALNVRLIRHFVL